MIDPCDDPWEEDDEPEIRATPNYDTIEEYTMDDFRKYLLYDEYREDL